jgi:hypothetical protein
MIDVQIPRDLEQRAMLRASRCGRYSDMSAPADEAGALPDSQSPMTAMGARRISRRNKAVLFKTGTIRPEDPCLITKGFTRAGRTTLTDQQSRPRNAGFGATCRPGCPANNQCETAQPATAVARAVNPVLTFALLPEGIQPCQKTKNKASFLMKRTRNSPRIKTVRSQRRKLSRATCHSRR